MKHRRLLCAFMSTVLFALPFFTGCSGSGDGGASSGTQISGSTQNPTPDMWKVDDNKGHSIYMIGTIHVGDESVNNMPDYVEQAYASCDSIAIEADISGIVAGTSDTTQYVSMMMYSDGTTIKDHITPEVYQGAVDKLTAANLYNELYDNFKPFIWTSLLGMTLQGTNGLDINHGFDVVMTNRARNDGKNVIEVESLESQFEMFNSFSDGLNNLMIAEYLKPNYEEFANKATLEIYNSWKAGTVSEDMVISSTFEGANAENEQYYQEYYEKLLIERNKIMAQAAMQYLENGSKVFLMVGVLHFYGNGGIVDLLQKSGYTVTEVH